MFRSRLDRIVLRVIGVILIVAGGVYGRSAYGRHLRHSLILAAQSGDTVTVKALLDRGVDPNTDGPDPKAQGYVPDPDSGPRVSAVQWAMTNRHYDTARALLQKGARVSAPELATVAVADPNPEAALTLIANGANGKAMLDLAIVTSKYGLVRTLLDRFPDYRARIAEDGALPNAASRGDVALMQTLIDYGAQVDARDATGATPLMRAAMVGQEPGVLFLLKHGANVYATTFQGVTARYYAIVQGHPEVAQQLLCAEAHVGLTEAKGLLNDHTRAATLFRQGNIDGAMAIWRQIIARYPADLDAHRYLAQALWNKRQFQPAAATLEQAVRSAPNNPEAHILLGGMRSQQNQPTAAISEYREALRLSPHDYMARDHLAVLFQRQGKLAEAIVETRAMVADHPANAWAHYLLSDRLYRQGDRKDAISEARIAASRWSALGDAHVLLGWLLLEDGQIKEAVEECATAVRLRPRDANAHANLGKAYTAQGRLNEAVNECRLALQLNPYDAEAHYDLGLALDKQHQRAQAIAELQTYISQAQQNPNERERVADARTHLQQWGANP